MNVVIIYVFLVRKGEWKPEDPDCISAPQPCQLPNKNIKHASFKQVSITGWAGYFFGRISDIRQILFIMISRNYAFVSLF